MSNPKQNFRRRLRNAIARPLTGALTLGLGIIPWTWAQRCGALLGRLLWRLGMRDRTRTLTHLDTAFPELSETERQGLGRRSMIHLGVTFAEVLHLVHRGPEAAAGHFEIRGWEHVAAASSDAGVVLIVTAHCGNWELMGPVFHSKHRALTGLVATLGDDWIQTLAGRFRKQLGSNTIARGAPGAASRLLSLRRTGGCLLALIDQDIRAQSVYVPFFGRPAHTPVGPAQLALRWSMPVVPGFCRRLEDGSHRIEFQSPLPTYETAQQLTAAITRAVEAQIRRQPDQWVWLHRRWRRQLPNDTEFLA